MSIGASTFQGAPAKWNASLTIHVNQWKNKQTDLRESNLDIISNVSYKMSDELKLNLATSLLFSNSDTYLNGRIWNNRLTGTIDKSNWVTEIGISAIQSQSKWSLWPSVNSNIHFSKSDQLQLFAKQEASFWGATELTESNPYISLISLQELNTSSELDNKLIGITKSVGLSYNTTRIDKLELTLNASYQKNSNSTNYRIGGHRDLLQISTADFDQISVGLNQLSIYANVDNILDTKYQVWSGYQNYGRNLSAGVLFKF